jgi:two-component system response regulator FixJ
VIVIVDDDEGYAVRAFADAASVLNAELPAEGCLVFDYRLPGMNGLDLLAELRRRGVHLPAVLITSLPGKWLRAQAAAANVPIIEKPLTGEALSNWVGASFPNEKRDDGANDAP